MREEENVAQTYDSCAIILSKRVLVELAERGSQALLHLRRKRLTPAGPVNGNELRKLVGTLNDLCQSLGYKCTMRGETGHLAHQQQRGVAQLHPFAGLDCQRCHTLGGNLRHQVAYASGDQDTVLVELVFPQHAGEYRKAQRLLRRDYTSWSSLVRAQSIQVNARTLVVLQLVQAHEAPPFLRNKES
jgi:hypothetical protein